MKLSMLFGPAIGALASASASCSSAHDGTLQQNWTISGTTTPSVCDLHRATQARVVVFDRALFVLATQYAPCNLFSTSIGLHEDTYTATMTFLDVNGSAVSDSRTTGPFNVLRDATTVQVIDFPVGAFVGH
jgi:hypothetical protein